MGWGWGWGGGGGGGERERERERENNAEKNTGASSVSQTVFIRTCCHDCYIQMCTCMHVCLSVCITVGAYMYVSMCTFEMNTK